MSRCIKNECKSYPEPTKNKVRGCPGGSQGRLGDHVGPKLPKAQKWSQKTANSWSLFGSKIETRTCFSWSCSFLFFSVFFLWFLSVVNAQSLDLGFFFASLWDLWAFEKTAESVVKAVNFRSLTPPIQSLFTSLGCWCVSMMICCRFAWFWAVLGPGSELF